MASCTDIITLALSKLGVAGGIKPPRPSDLNLGLTALRSIYRSLIASGGLGPIHDVVMTGDYTARPNDRILRRPGVTGSVSFPDLVSDRCFGTADDYGFGEYDSHQHRPHKPRDGSFVIMNDEVTGNTADWMYEAYTAKWVSLYDLSLQQYEEVRDQNGGLIEVRQPSIAPLSIQDENGLAALLATKLVDHFGATLNPTTIRDATIWQQALVSRFGEHRREVRGQFY